MLEICRRKPESSHGGWELRFSEVNNILIVGSNDAVHLGISKHIFNLS